MRVPFGDGYLTRAISIAPGRGTTVVFDPSALRPGQGGVSPKNKPSDEVADQNPTKKPDTTKPDTTKPKPDTPHVVAKFCPNCGQRSTPGAKFCSKCGKKLPVIPKPDAK